MTTRIFTDQKLIPHEHIELAAASSAHLIKVLRYNVGDSVHVFNGDGYDYVSKICKTGKRAVLRIEQQLPGLPKSPLEITLVQGISRGDRMDFSVQKAVELGVHAIQPVFTEKTKVKLDNERLLKKIQHWEAIAISACEQCGRSDLPEIKQPLKLSHFLKNRTNQLSLVLAFGNHPNITQAVPTSANKLAILIGPESGLSENEITQAVSSGWLCCQIGPRVLRTETATITALSLLQHIGGDLKSPM